MVILHPHNPAWKNQFEVETQNLRQALSPHALEIHHIGSTAIPDLIAKADLDVVCVVDNLKESLKLQNMGYTFKGELNIPLRYYFSKNTDTSKVNLHVVEQEHGFIALNLCFRDYLRQHSSLRDAYGALKQRLVQDPHSHERAGQRFKRYTLEKNVFIKNILTQADFQGMMVNFCLHDQEWAAYEQMAGPRNTDDQHFHFVLYKGPTIIGAAQVETLSPTAHSLHAFAIDESFQNQGWEESFRTFLETWMNHKSFHPIP